MSPFLFNSGKTDCTIEFYAKKYVRIMVVRLPPIIILTLQNFRRKMSKKNGMFSPWITIITMKK